MSKIISGDSRSSADYQPWTLPLVEDVSARVAEAKQDKVSGLLTAERIEQIQNQAFEEAYAEGLRQGREEGLKAAQREVTQKLGLLEDLLQSLARPFEKLDASVEVELVQLALAIARQLVRRELKADPGEVVGVVHEALAALPVASRNIRVHLHPEDVALLRDMLSQSNEERQWSLNEDPSLQRGDCRVVTETSQIEATLERRLAAVMAKIMGGERHHDAPSQD